MGMTARAYVYAGDWVADCTQDACGNVEFLHRRSRMNGPRDVPLDFFSCSHCGTRAPITWPDDPHALLAELSRRPVPSTRNWYPLDHPVAIKFGLPHGQSVRGLAEEAEEHGVLG